MFGPNGSLCQGATLQQAHWDKTERTVCRYFSMLVIYGFLLAVSRQLFLYFNLNS
jgi:hypothetical protein